jgi:hypothetical protein
LAFSLQPDSRSTELKLPWRRPCCGRSIPCRRTVSPTLSSA